jgi:MoaA/NifB/PqqE/SkfB family radical SAM enzyme
MKIGQILKYSLIKNKLNLPVSLILLITAKCNSNCQFCFFKERLNKNYKELTLDEIENLSRSLKKLSRLIISGGEPFVRTDLVKICKTFFKNNEVDELAIPTNGLLPAQITKMTKQILDACPGINLMITISIDGPPKINDKIRGIKNSYHKAVESYQSLIKLKKQYTQLRVHVTTTLSKYNYKYIDELIELVKKDMPELNSHNFEFIRNKHSEYSPDLPTFQQCLEFQKKHEHLIVGAKQHFGKSKIKSLISIPIKKYKFDLLINILKKRKQPITCLAGKVIGMVNEVGDVFLCELLPPVGNIRETSFLKAWHSQKANKQREMISKKKCWCTHSCFQGTNILYNPKNYLNIIKYIFK